VIFNAGAGQDLRVWSEVEEELSEFARVVTWSRPGLGRSGMGRVGRGSPRVVEELRAVLEEVEVDPPYVLVGHALGAFHVRVFAALHREEVSGLVLIDPSHEEWLERLKQTRTAEEWAGIGDAFHEEVNSLTEGARREYASIEDDSERMKLLSPPPAVPIWILSCGRLGEAERAAGRRPADIALWQDLHAELAESMSEGSRVAHRVRPDLGADLLSEAPEAVVEAVRWVLRESAPR